MDSTCALRLLDMVVPTSSTFSKRLDVVCRSRAEDLATWKQPRIEKVTRTCSSMSRKGISMSISTQLANMLLGDLMPTWSKRPRSSART